MINAGAGGRYAKMPVTTQDVKDAKAFRDTNKSATAVAAAKVGKGKKGELRVSGRGLGVVSLFPEKEHGASAYTSLKGKKGSKNVGVQALLKRGVTGVTMTDIQMSDLQTMQKNEKKGINPTRNRRLISKYFTKGLLDYGRKLTSGIFQNDEEAAIQAKLSKVIKQGTSGGVDKTAGGSTALFSSSVEGGIFEAAINLITKGAANIEDFKGHVKEQKPFDFEEGGPATKKFKDAFFGGDKLLRRADAKRTAGNAAVATIIYKALATNAERKKILTEAKAQGFTIPKSSGKVGVGKARGYIPNYVGTLEDAVIRENVAGVPINQIRVNQSGKLRNAANPQGLAVTNTRDEPTGRVPNFARGGVGGASSDLLTKFIVLQMVVSGLSGIVSETSSNAETFNKALKAMNLAMTAMFAASAFGGVGKTFSGAGRFLTGKTGAAMAVRGRRMTDLGFTKLSRPSTSMLPPAKGVEWLREEPPEPLQDRF